MLKRRNTIKHLIYVHGFELGLRETGLRVRVSTALRRYASRIDVPLIEVETNLREFTDRYAVLWGAHLHGCALASVGQSLGNLCSEIYIPSTYSYAQIFPWGSHPLLDPLWSTEFVSVVHDGCEAGRIAKINAIAGDDQALSMLRVCWENRNGAYNCGECEKCLRTMTSLEILGALKRCSTFDRQFSLEAIGNFKLSGQGPYIHWNENHQAALENQKEDIAAAIDIALSSYRTEKAASSLLELFDGLVGSPIWEDLLKTKCEAIFKSFWSVQKHWLTKSCLVHELKSLLAAIASKIGLRPDTGR